MPQVGKFGRNTAIFPGLLHDITHYFAGNLPKPPASVAVNASVDWDMDGNDTYGDCGPAGLKHAFQNAALVTKESEQFPTADQVVQYYLTYTGGQDQGVVLSDFLKYVEKEKFFGHTVSAYAPVQFKDIPTLQFAIYAYTFAYTGIVVTNNMMAAFQNGQPWTLDVCLDQPEGGHCIPLVGYDSQYLYAVTWGKVQPIAYSAWSHIADESWAVITGEMAKGDGHGLNLDALQDDIRKLDR